MKKNYDDGFIDDNGFFCGITLILILLGTILFAI